MQQLDAAATLNPRGLGLSMREIVAVFILLFYAVNAYIPIIMPNTGGALTDTASIEQSHAANHVILAFMWMLSFAVVVKSWRRLDFRSNVIRLGILYSLWACLSMLWSGVPVATLSDAIGLVFSTYFAVYLFSAFDRRRLTMVFTWVLMIVAVASIGFALLVPKYGIDHFTHEGDWQGILYHKNMLGAIMVYGTAIAMTFQPTNFIERMWRASYLLPVLERQLSPDRVRLG